MAAGTDNDSLMTVGEALSGPAAEASRWAFDAPTALWVLAALSLGIWAVSHVLGRRSAT